MSPVRRGDVLGIDHLAAGVAAEHETLRSSQGDVMTLSMRLAAAGAVLSLALGAWAIDDVDVAGADVGSADPAISSHACPEGVPPELAPAPDQDLSFVLSATGVQKYTCASTATGAAWTLVAPDAQLFKNGHRVGTHDAGPTWRYRDGSTVVGAKAAEATPDASAIPWLLLTATSHAGERGRMTGVTSIQRMSTTGGRAPATGCDADHIGAASDVPYTADYFFYQTRTKHQEHNVRCGQ
jgi:hypothetical protein